jgi:methionyl-tRNA formyltransferase
VHRGIVEIDEAISSLSWLIVVHAPRKTLRYHLRSQWRNVRRNGWRWIPYQLAEAWQRALTKVSPPASAERPGSEFSREVLLRRPNLRVVNVADMHAQSTLDTVRAFDPELGISLAAPILRRSLFAIPARGTVNLHKGKLPEFRGMPPAFWELWHDQTSIGCSVHRVDDGLDTGALIAERSIPRGPYSTVRGLQLQLDEIGIEMMSHVVRDMLAGRSIERAQTSGAGRTHRKPTLQQEAMLKRRLETRIPWADRPRQLVKEARGAAGFALHRLGLCRVLAPRITVLLYHRVSDDVRDNLTVGIEQFDRQMAFLARYFRVVFDRRGARDRDDPTIEAPVDRRDIR